MTNNTLMWGGHSRPNKSLSEGLWKQLDSGYKILPLKESLERGTSPFFEALKQYLSKFPPETYEQTLAKKLERVRAQIEYNNMWRRPTLEECKAGLEIEMMSSYGWFKGTYPSILRQETHMNLFYGHLTDEEKYSRASLRIKNK